MDISVLIINYNTAELVKTCIESVLNQQGVSFEIIVIDNHSQDESVTVLQTFSSQITFVANQDNKGFGRANNQAFALCKGRYIFMLNPDAICLSSQDLLNAIQFMDAHPEYGLVGTRIINADNQLENTVYSHYPRQKQARVNFSDLPGKLAAVLGASMIVRREIFLQMKGFDEEFFLYGEETDLCLRIRKAGYQIGYCDAVTVRHIGSASEKGNTREEVMRKKKMGKLLFYRKHYPVSDVNKIVKKDFNHARWHLFRLSFISKLFGLNKSQKNQHKHYAMVRELTRDYLKNNKMW